MATINSAFGIMTQALDADQAALSIVANNVANASTPGYTKEIPQWQEDAPVTINGAPYGQGVTETGPRSVRDRVLTERLDQQQQLASASNARLSALDTMQTLFTPDSGSTSATAGDIGNDITAFFSSFTTLEANPTNDADRQGVLSAAATLSSDISGAASSLNAQRSDLDQEVAGIGGQVNSLTASIAQLNQQIQTSSPEADAGTLEDQREEDVSQLSNLIGINQITTENNGLSITTTSGDLLVSEGTSFQMTNGTVDGITHLFVGTKDITSGLTGGGGELGGDLTARDQDIPSSLASLDQLAYGISTEVNAQNNAGIDMNGQAGGNIFSSSSAVTGSALTMSVKMTDANGVAAAGSGQGSGGNLNATALANLGNVSNPPILNGLTLSDGQTLAAGQTLLNGQTPSDYFSSFVSSLGSTVSEVQTENTAQTASVTQLQTQNDALSSVNLNDEASAMSTLETSYQAAAKVFSILSTVMTSALNLGQETTVS
jgi:flagellar hook-associated protein 1 FlgK